MPVKVFDKFPNCLVIGEGAVDTIGDHIRKFGEIKKVAVITDQGLKALPIVTNLVELLSGQGFEPLLFGEVRSLPTDRNVIDTAEKMKSFGAEAIVAIGGGSALDCARAANALYSYGGAFADHNPIYGKYEYSREILKPYIAIPTTSGTGSEVAAAAGIIITDPITGDASSFFAVRSPQLIPDVSIIDPLMSAGMDPALTAATGMDALTHAYESMVSSNEFPLAAGLSLEAIYLVFNNLRTAVFNGGNIPARENMAISAAAATMAFQQCGLGLVHGISEGLSAYSLIPHGIANGILLPPVMKFNAPCTLDKMVRIAAAMGVNTFDVTKQRASAQAIKEVKILMHDVGLPATLSEYFSQREKNQPEIFRPIKREVIKLTTDFALNSHFVKTNPRSVTEKDILAILDEQFDGYRFAD